MAVLAVGIVASAPGLSFADDSASATAAIVVSAHVSSRTSLAVSHDLLRFEPTDSGTATASVDFSAGGRTHGGAQITLSLQTGGVSCASGDAQLTFTGSGPGVSSGTVEGDTPAIAARWIGSGRRTGRLVFTLRGDLHRGCEVPVRFVLTTP